MDLASRATTEESHGPRGLNTHSHGCTDGTVMCVEDKFTVTPLMFVPTDAFFSESSFSSRNVAVCTAIIAAAGLSNDLNGLFSNDTFIVVTT